MTKKNFRFNISLDENEFVQVGNHVYTTHEILKREEHNIVVIGSQCLKVLKDFQDRLTMEVVREWLLLSQALDQSCSYRSKWDDHKILEELLAGRAHSISWYVENCHSPE